MKKQQKYKSDLLTLTTEVAPGITLQDYIQFEPSIAIFSAELSNNGRYVAVACENELFIIDLLKQTRELYHRAEQEVQISAWSNNDECIAISSGHSIIVIDFKSKLIKRYLQAHKSWVNALIFIDEKNLLISGSNDKTVRKWDLTNGKSTIVMNTKNTVTDIFYSKKNGQIVITEVDGVISYVDIEYNNLKSFFEFDYSSSVFLNSTLSNKYLAYSTGNIIQFFDRKNNIESFEIDAHNAPINGLCFIENGRFLVSKSFDETVKIWDCRNWSCLASFSESVSNITNLRISYNSRKKLLITRFDNDCGLRIWKLNPKEIIKQSNGVKVIKYTTAKIVLVGDSGVGKTGLGWRLSMGAFKEHESTHGQQFWVVDDLGITRSDGTECEAVLWDLAGQPDYRLVHSLFLENVNLGLILFDPTKSDSMASPRFWLNQLQKNQAQVCPTILIGSRADRGTSTLTNKELSEFAAEHEINGGYLATSAKTNEGLDELVKKIKSLIPWDKFSTTITTVTFKRIKEFILKLKENVEEKINLVSYLQLSKELIKYDPSLIFNDQELKAAVQNLENHGYVSIIKNSKQETFVLLFPDLIINLASSFILEARKNLKGLGVLEERKLLDGNYNFSELKDLPAKEREIIINATTALFLKNAICFRETWNDESFYVFPSLINEKRPSSEEQELIEDVSYIITGAVENVYASMVVLLGYTNTFTRNNQWQNQAEYRLGKDERCGFKQISNKEGETEFILYHIKNIPNHTKVLFEGLFERFLVRRDIKIKKYTPVVCSNCNEPVDRSVVLKQLARDKNQCFCSDCATMIDLTKAEEILDNNLFEEALDEQKFIAIRKTLFETQLVKIKSLLRDNVVASPPSCFICYAWGEPENEAWAERLALNLRNAGLKVLFDKNNNKAGSSISGYVDNIMKVDFILAIGTTKLVEKYNAEITDPVVKAEHTLINTILRRPNEHGQKVIPLLLEGTQQSSFTPLLQDIVFIDFTYEKYYFYNLAIVIGQLYGIDNQDNFMNILASLKPTN